MSADVLRNTARQALREKAASVRSALEGNIQAPLEQLRAWQGELRGLKFAEESIDECYRKMNG